MQITKQSLEYRNKRKENAKTQKINKRRSNKCSIHPLPVHYMEKIKL